MDALSRLSGRGERWGIAGRGRSIEVEEWPESGRESLYEVIPGGGDVAGSELGPDEAEPWVPIIS